MAQADNHILGLTPKYIIEAIGMTLIALFAYSMTISNRVEDVFPLLAIFALGAQRLLPAIQQLYASWTTVRASKNILDDVLELMDKSQISDENFISKEKIDFKKKIEINNLCFNYIETNKKILKNVSFSIEKGSKVGVTGTTGGGKSTLIDLILGLLQPTNGSIKIDSIKLNNENIREWQNSIAHVPQVIFLTDTSIRENIAFGVEAELIDNERIKKAAKLANCEEFIDELENGYETIVGERGAKLSGGQRQRIGIARALYKNADVLIFDEATSALDIKTEKKIIDSVIDLNPRLTIIMIAHRMASLEKCDYILNVEGGEVIMRLNKV